MKVKFVTPNGLYKEVESKTLSVLSTDGWRCILDNHMPIVLMLQISRLETVEDNKKVYYAIGGGMLYFENNLARVLVDSIEQQDEIDIDRANNSKQRAQGRLASKDSNIDLKRAEVSLKKAINRIDVYSYK